MKILEEKNNELLKRKEVKMIIDAEKNPSMQEVAKIIAQEFKSEEGNIAIRGIKGKFGRKTFLINAFVYNTKEAKEQTEPKIKKKKKSANKEKPTQAPIAEQPKEEKPAEKTKEENKGE